MQQEPHYMKVPVKSSILLVFAVSFVNIIDFQNVTKYIFIRLEVVKMAKGKEGYETRTNTGNWTEVVEWSYVLKLSSHCISVTEKYQMCFREKFFNMNIFCIWNICFRKRTYIIQKQQKTGERKPATRLHGWCMT